ncbi:MAG: hypothetical protein RLP15_01440 [Cryomorphaceae bacterium]
MATKEDPIVLLTDSVKTSLTQVVQLKATLKQREDAIAQLESKNLSLSNQLQKEQATVAEQREKILADKTQIEAQQATISASEKELSDHKAKLKEVTESAKDLAAKIKALEKEKAKEKGKGKE